MSVPITSMQRAASRSRNRLSAWRFNHPLAAGILLGAILSIAAGLVLVPLGRWLGAANVALALALVVMLISFRWGRAAGVSAAVSAGVSYAAFHSVPHGLPWTEDLEDAGTALLLVAVGLLAALAREGRLRSETVSRRRLFGVQWVHEVAERAARGDPLDAIRDTVAEGLMAELRLESCEFVEGGRLAARPVLERSGVIQDLDGNPVGPDSREAIQFQLPVRYEEVQLGRFDLTRRGGPPGHDECMVAVVLADCLAVAIHSVTAAGPSDADQSDGPDTER